MPRYSSSAGEEVCDLAAAAGLPLMGWQRHVLIHGLGERPDGKWAAPRVVTKAPRQNGKGGIIEARELGGLFLLGERLILHSAHEYKTAQEGFLRIKGLIENTPDLDRLVNRYWQANGEQGIELTTGARLRFVARSRGSGRGFSGDCNILDEDQELTLEQMAALMPTISARPNPQLWFFGTPPQDPDAWIYELYEAGEQGTDPRLAYFNWGADLDITDKAQAGRLDDRDLWYATNPALGILITEDTVADERRLLRDKFAAERLGAWLPRAAGGGAIPAHAWAAAGDEHSEPGDDVAFALDVSPSRDCASIAMYGLRPDGVGHGELVEHRDGTDWVVPRVLQLRERWNPVGIGLDPKGPAGSLVMDLEAAGVTVSDDQERPDRGDLVLMGGQEMAAACGQMVDAVTQATLRHIGQRELDAAVAGAKFRPLGDAQAFGRRISSVPINPLVALTIARWVYVTRAHLVSDADYDLLASFY